MAKRISHGYWMVLILGARAYLQQKGNRDPKGADIYHLLNDLGLLKDALRKRTPLSIRATIYQRLQKL